MPFRRAPWTGLSPLLTRFLMPDDRRLRCAREPSLSLLPLPSPSPSPSPTLMPVLMPIAASFNAMALHHPDASRDEIPARSRRGRKRKLPVMSNSERAKYYRRKNAAARTQLDREMAQLQREINELEMKVAVRRQLVTLASAEAQTLIADHVWHFVTTQLASATRGLRDCSADLVSIQVLGSAEAPVVQVRANLHGRLLTRVVHDIYPFVLGNTVALDTLMHHNFTYQCSYSFFYAADGSVQHQQTEVDTKFALRGVLPNLATVARVLTHVDVHEPELTPPAPPFVYTRPTVAAAISL